MFYKNGHDFMLDTVFGSSTAVRFSIPPILTETLAPSGQFSNKSVNLIQIKPQVERCTADWRFLCKNFHLSD